MSAAATPSERTAPSALAVAFALGSVYVLWGSTYLGIRFALHGYPPFLLGAIRMFLAGAIMYAVLRWRGTPPPTRRQWRTLWLLSIWMVLLSNGLVNLAETQVDSGLAAIAVASMPLFAGVFAMLRGRHPSKIEWIGLTIGFLGVIWLNAGGKLSASPLGLVCLIVAPVAWAWGSIWSRDQDLPSPFMAAAAQMLTGGVWMLGAAVLTGERITAMPGLSATAALLYLVVAGSIFGFTAYIWLLHHVRPALATSYAYVNPPIAVLFGALLAGERFSAHDLGAMAVILVGVGIITLAKARAGRPAAAAAHAEPAGVPAGAAAMMAVPARVPAVLEPAAIEAASQSGRRSRATPVSGVPADRRGLWIAVASFVLWGVMPLYWHLLKQVPSLQIVAHRIVWSTLLVSAWLCWKFGRHWLRDILREPRKAAMLGLSGVLIAFNWGLYIWAVNAGHVIETSLGYFIGPLVSVMFGVLFLGERLRALQWLAIALAFGGVLWLTFQYGRPPVIALSLAVSFAVYGLVRKLVAVEAVTGLGVENVYLFAPALALMLWGESHGQGGFVDGWGLGTAVLLVIAGALTALPMIGFAYAVRRVPLTAIGLLQYIAPTLQFLIGVLILREPFDAERAIGFAIIWAGLIVFAGEGWARSRRMAAAAMPAA